MDSVCEENSDKKKNWNDLSIDVQKYIFKFLLGSLYDFDVYPLVSQSFNSFTHLNRIWSKITFPQLRIEEFAKSRRNLNLCSHVKKWQMNKFHQFLDQKIQFVTFSL